MEIFKKLGPRVILVEHRGRLTGLVTVKDCLKYQFQVEAHDNPRDDSAQQAGQERLWSYISRSAGWFKDRAGKVSGGRLRLGERDDRRERSSVDLAVEPLREGGLELDDRRNVV